MKKWLLTIPIRSRNNVCLTGIEFLTACNLDIVSAMDFPFRIKVHLSGLSSPTYLGLVKSKLFILIPATEKKTFLFLSDSLRFHPREYLTVGGSTLLLYSRYSLSVPE